MPVHEVEGHREDEVDADTNGDIHEIGIQAPGEEGQQGRHDEGGGKAKDRVAEEGLHTFSWRS